MPNHSKQANVPPGHIPFADFQKATQDAVTAAVNAALAATIPVLAAQIPQQPSQPSNQVINAAEVSNLIPCFDPVSIPHQTSKMWLRKIDETAAAYGWNERFTINHALPKLRGTARVWYEGLDSVVHTWPEWKKLIEEWFPPNKSSQSLHLDMQNRTRKPEESIEQYYHDKVAKARMCGLTDLEMIEYIITGLKNENLITSLSMKEFTSPPQLLQCVQQLEGRLRISNADKPKAPEATAYSRNSSRQENTKEQNVSNGNTKKNSNNNNSENKNNNRAERKPRMNEKGEFLCYNCSEYGHIASGCPKPPRPRNGAGGRNNSASKPRTTENNTVPKTTLHLDSTHGQEGNDKYFKDAYLNGQPIQAYVDMGSQCVTIRESNAKELGLSIEPVSESCFITGYGSGKIQPKGKTLAKLKVDQASAEVELFVVTDETQKIPLLVGQPFTEQRNVTVVKRLNVLRIFEESSTEEEMNDECLQTLCVPELPKQMVSLWTKSATVIPTNYVGFVNLSTENEYCSEKDIYIDSQLRMSPGREYFVPRGIYSVSPEKGIVMPIINMSENTLTFEKGQRMARAKLCQAEVQSENQVLHMEQTTMKPITMEEIEVGATVSQETRNRLHSMLNEYRVCFASNISELGKTNTASMNIELTSDEPITYRPYRLASSEKQKVRTQLNELLEADIIEHSTSPYASPMLVVKKKNGGERLCIDYRALNKVTKKDAYPLPLIDEQLERLQGNNLFTSLDLMSGYYQIPVEEGSREKTAFVTPEGHFQFKTMPFGLSTAPAVFQRMMDKVLGDLKYEFALTYLDDVLSPSNGEEQGLERLKKILEVLRKSNLTLNLKKCKFLQENIDYLGFEISASGIKPGSHKIASVENFPVPKNLHEVRRFLGLTSYFRRFIKGFAGIAEPLSRLLRKDVEWSWGPEQENTFQDLKSRLSQRPILTLFDATAELEVHTDASQIGIGVMLMQKNHEGKLNPIAYASRKTTKDESKYHSSELETLAVIWGLEKYRVYLIGKKFTVVTDCNSLRSTFTKKQLVPRIARWWLKVLEYEFEVVHRPGTQMAHVDALSRAPWGEPEETETSDGIQILHLQLDNDDWLAAAQFQDSKLKGIKETLKKTGHLTKEERRLRQEYVLKNERLFKKSGNGDQTEETLLWVVPDHSRWRIVKLYHDDIGHFGAAKTIQKIQEDYWFPRLTRYVKRYISSCLECLYHKQPSGRKPGKLHSIDQVGIPFDTIHIDHLGPFVKSALGNTFLIVAVDAFTKFVILKAVRNSGMNPTRRFVEELISIFGPPRRIITDQGTAYTGKAFKELCKKMNIIHCANATATPRGNGQVERINRMLTPAIGSMSQNPNEKDWDKHLCEIAWGVNNTFHQATKRTPFGLLFNYPSRSPHGNFLEDSVREPVDPVMEKKRTAALDSIKADQEKQRLRYNAKRAKAPTLEPGDLVVVERQPAATGAPLKTAVKYKGPYVVSKKLNYDRYIIEDLPENQRTQKFYRNTAPIDKLKRFYINDNFDIDSEDSEGSPEQPESVPILAEVTNQKVPSLQSEDALPDSGITMSSPPQVPTTQENTEQSANSVHVFYDDGSEEEIARRSKSDRVRKLPKYLKDYEL